MASYVHLWNDTQSLLSTIIATYYTVVQINKCLKRASANKVATMKIMDIQNVPTTKLTLLAVKKDEWDTKESTGKSMKNALHIQ